MPVITNNPELVLKNLFEETLRSGGMTHGFVACGRLDATGPDFELNVGGSDTVFDLASLTKALYVTPEVFSRVRSGSFGLSSRLRDCSERFGGGKYKALGGLTVAELLSHTSGLKDWLSLWMACPGTSWDLLSPENKSLALIEGSGVSPKTQGISVYSDLGFILLGILLKSLPYAEESDEALRRRRFGTGFSSQIPEGALIASSGYCPVRKRVLRGEVHDENAWYLGGDPGHAGLFSTGRGLIGYLRDLMQSSVGEQLIAAQIARRNPGGGMTGLMGWQQGAGETSFAFGRGKGIGHLGFTGTAFWVVPESETYGIVLTNRIISGRTCKWINQFRATAFEALDQIVHGHL